MSATERYWCDLAEEANTVPAVRTGVAIGYEGETWVVDLGEDALKAVEELMTAVRSRGRRVSGGPAPDQRRYQSKAAHVEHGRRVRGFARSNGWPGLGDGGPIPLDAIDLYNEANPRDRYETRR